LGEEYRNYNLVIALPNGRPCEGRVLLKSFKELREKAVVFDSLRHSSTTYKLKINQGDLKATQGDGGWATLDMITKIYAHIVDDDRRIHAQEFDAAFYSYANLQDAFKTSSLDKDLKLLIEQLQQQPEFTNTLAQIISVAQAVKCSD
jgi:hypothetical protein